MVAGAVAVGATVDDGTGTEAVADGRSGRASCPGSAAAWPMHPLTVNAAIVTTATRTAALPLLTVTLTGYTERFRLAHSRIHAS
ncbi:hypothetical protein GCM10025883_20020 [Mobilicoccus caccae]|uniref:Uncharacterized protein n=1 Tax=Mobilicoccus caccae TaxID=1859295 RepID=A0ABQ6IPW2_9MICO|nr:hypothetical protein GCM10025883_20020 [Mobilicoccus caccae]